MSNEEILKTLITRAHSQSLAQYGNGYQIHPLEFAIEAIAVEGIKHDEQRPRQVLDKYIELQRRLNEEVKS